MRKIFTPLFILGMFAFLTESGMAQHSVARQWNEQLLDAIRVSTSRPTVHSRNLFHFGAVMYDAWAAYDDVANTFLLGNQVGEYFCEFEGVDPPATDEEIKVAREEAISYAAYRLMRHRFANSPGAAIIMPRIDSLMTQLGYDTSVISTDYINDGPAALGNYIALSCMEFGMVDYSDEDKNYAYAEGYYDPVNDPLFPAEHGNPNITDMNHWQPLAADGVNPRKFLNPQWGKVTPFSMTEEDLTVYDKEGNEYYVYHDPGAPPVHDTTGNTSGLDDYYKWNHALVAVWSGHLDPDDGVMIDISPASVGNLTSLPTNEEEMRAFYNFLDGGVADTGYTVNPATGAPYEPQIVPMGDFGRVLAEFWADGPNSETPPGHWFTILNYVSDHPDFEKRYEGEGDILDDLEWDVKAYLTMGGAMHDVAVAVWGMKSHYDFIRPISAIRGMAELGQSSDTAELSYHPGGIPLVEGHIEVVKDGDPLAGEQGENIGKIKLYAWKGPDYISETEHAGVDWILAGDWWPYQRPSFITPPFAGYVSGHSTFSRAAAEVMTLITGDEYFPGGMGIFDALMNEYLVFEEGPSIDIELQWAKYRDASDQASLSRLWGGIHPPIDDVPGRQTGQKIGPEAHEFAKGYFTGSRGGTTSNKDKLRPASSLIVKNYPNPVVDFTTFEYAVKSSSEVSIHIYDMSGRLIQHINEGIKSPGVHTRNWEQAGDILNAGVYFYQLQIDNQISTPKKMVVLDR